jgi:uncharacterized protein YmfQ (DUF2313 family)
MTADEYVEAILKSMPPGRLDLSLTSNIGLLIAAFADGCARQEARALQLIEEADPRTTVALLPDWERNYGLPDPCSGPADSTAGRQIQLAAKVHFRGGQSAAFFIALAASYGFTITVTKLPPFGLQINAPLNTITYADCFLSSCIDPLASWGNTVLECVLNRAAHGHTTLVYAYT